MNRFFSRLINRRHYQLFDSVIESMDRVQLAIELLQDDQSTWPQVKEKFEALEKLNLQFFDDGEIAFSERDWDELTKGIAKLGDTVNEFIQSNRDQPIARKVADEFCKVADAAD